MPRIANIDLMGYMQSAGDSLPTHGVDELCECVSFCMMSKSDARGKFLSQVESVLYQELLDLLDKK